MRERHNDFVLFLILGGFVLLLAGMVIGFLINSILNRASYEINELGDPVTLHMQREATLELQNASNAYFVEIGFKGREAGVFRVDKMEGQINYFAFYYPDNMSNFSMIVSIATDEIRLHNLDTGGVKTIAISPLFEGIADSKPVSAP